MSQKSTLRQNSLLFRPEKIGWIGASLLILSCFCALPFLLSMQCGAFLSETVHPRKERLTLPKSYAFSLLSNEGSFGLSIPELQGKMTFSFDPPRPLGAVHNQRLLVRLKETFESKRVVLPCRLDLEFQAAQLKFAPAPSLFWVDLTESSSNQIEAKVWITSPDGAKIDAGRFTVTGQDCPIQDAGEFSEGSPFRLLADAKWWGRDLFRENAAVGERIEIGPELLEMKESDWLIWNEGKWQKGAELPLGEVPIAKIQSLMPKMLVLEGWDAAGHTRIGLALSQGPPFKTKGEELFTSIRVRSEKQISCMLEKQCMVLKIGDWILKAGGRWKVLRKKDEKDAFLNGKLFGELFILDQIGQKQGQKMIQGRLFNPGRTQVVSIDMPVQARLKAGQKWGGKP